MELVEKVDNMAATEADPQQASVEEAVNMVTEGTPQGSPATMELMEEDNQIEEEAMTTPNIEPTEVEEKGQEGPRAGEAMGPVEEALGELGREVGANPQEPMSTSELNIEDSFQFSFFSSIPRGARVTRSPQQKKNISPSLEL